MGALSGAYVTNHSRLFPGLILCAIVAAAPAYTQDHSRNEAGGMSHGDEQSREMIDYMRKIAPSMVDRSDEEIIAVMNMMPPNYERYISDKSFNGEIGVLVVTHGFGEIGDKIFAESLEPVATVYPTAVAFGMAMMKSDHIQSAVDDLVAAGAKTIVAVPATQSRHDTGIRQYQYILGHRAEPGYMAVPRAVTSARILFTPPLADHPLVSDILLDYARELSTNQETEVVIIVGHGPSGDEDNARELEMMARHARRMRENSEFADVKVINLQDDALKTTRAANVETLRGLAEAAIQEGHRVLIVGFLLGTAGIQPKIESDLEGLDYRFNPRGMSEHPNFARWVAEMVSEAAEGG